MHGKCTYERIPGSPWRQTTPCESSKPCPAIPNMETTPGEDESAFLAEFRNFEGPGFEFMGDDIMTVSCGAAISEEHTGVITYSRPSTGMNATYQATFKPGESIKLVSKTQDPGQGQGGS